MLATAAAKLQDLFVRLHQAEAALRQRQLDAMATQGSTSAQDVANLQRFFSRLEHIEVVLAGRNVQFLNPHKALIPGVINNLAGAQNSANIMPTVNGTVRKGSARKSSLTASLGGGKLRKSSRAQLRKASKARAMNSKIDDKFNEFENQ